MYGSLRREIAHPMHSVLQQNSEFVAEAFVAGRLYAINDYPGVVLSTDPADKVYGELYRLLDVQGVLAVLDAYEECSADFPPPHEYQRLPLNVMLSAERITLAWVYVYQYPVQENQRIASGDYLQFIRSRIAV